MYDVLLGLVWLKLSLGEGEGEGCYSDASLRASKKSIRQGKEKWKSAGMIKGERPPVSIAWQI